MSGKRYPHHWTWDRNGKLRQVLYHTPEEHRRFVAGLPVNAPAPETSTSNPEPRRIKRGAIQETLL